VVAVKYDFLCDVTRVSRLVTAKLEVWGTVLWEVLQVRKIEIQSRASVSEDTTSRRAVKEW